MTFKVPARRSLHSMKCWGRICVILNGFFIYFFYLQYDTLIGPDIFIGRVLI